MANFDYVKICNKVKANCMEVLQSQFSDGNTFNLLMSDKKFSDCCDDSCEFHPYHIWNCKHFRKCILDFTNTFKMNWLATKFSDTLIQTLVPHDKERLQFTVLARMHLPLHYNSIGECFHGHIKSMQLIQLSRLMLYDCSTFKYLREKVAMLIVDDDIASFVGIHFERCSSCESCKQEFPIASYPAGCPNNVYHYDGSKVVKGGVPKKFFMKPVGEDGDREVFCVVQLQVISCNNQCSPLKSMITAEAGKLLLFEEDFKPLDFGKEGNYEVTCCEIDCF